MVPAPGTVPVSGVLDEGTVHVWTGTCMRYTRDTIRYISNAGGRDGIFFLLLNTPPFLNRQFLWNRFSSPPVSDHWYGTELTPLLFDGVGCICMILIENGCATLSLLKKVCNSI